ncbi:MAG: hypothetical protein JJP05_09630 [cyanobacterium endosymbiont of Rhopalodia gibba]
MNFTKIDLANFIFLKANLIITSLSDLDLKEAKLNMANLQEDDLQSVNLALPEFKDISSYQKTLLEEILLSNNDVD